MCLCAVYRHAYTHVCARLSAHVPHKLRFQTVSSPHNVTCLPHTLLAPHSSPPHSSHLTPHPHALFLLGFYDTLPYSSTP